MNRQTNVSLSLIVVLMMAATVNAGPIEEVEELLLFAAGDSASTSCSATSARADASRAEGSGSGLYVSASMRGTQDTQSNGGSENAVWEQATGDGGSDAEAEAGARRATCGADERPDPCGDMQIPPTIGELRDCAEALVGGEDEAAFVSESAGESSATSNVSLGCLADHETTTASYVFAFGLHVATNTLYAITANGEGLELDSGGVVLPSAPTLIEVPDGLEPLPGAWYVAFEAGVGAVCVSQAYV